MGEWQAQRRRWLKKKFLMLPGASLLVFLYIYIANRCFLDGRRGIIYASFLAVQAFHIKAKIYELQLAAGSSQVAAAPGGRGAARRPAA